MRDFLADILTGPAIPDPTPAPPELVRLRARLVAERHQNGTAPCGERTEEGAILCDRRRRIVQDGVPGGCGACSRAGV